MSRRRLLTLVFVATACLMAVATTARAQSAIAGVVKDTSGAVLPGVTVEVASDALIEKTKSTTTDGGGQYRIIDLRPGMYTVSFTLTGFSTVKRDSFQLPSDFTANISVEMKVGAMEETITVTGAAPIVDVKSAAHVQVLDRDALETIPTGHTIQGIGQLIVGIQLSSPDVGGAFGAMQTYMTVRGQSAAANTVMVDGMVMNGLENNGQVQSYYNDVGNQEMTYQTSGVNAENSGGGVTLNMVPKEGGNRFSGSSSYANRPGQWQGDNLSDRLTGWGLKVGSSTEYISDLTASEGGPIKKDKVWFFGTARDFRTANRVANTFFDDGTQGDDYNYVRNANIRLTYAMSPRHKVSAFYERISKWRAHDMQSLQDPETTSNRWWLPNASTGSAKYTGTLSSRLLLEGGYSQTTLYRDIMPQLGITKQRGTPEWYATASHSATGGGLGVSPATWSKTFPLSRVWQGSTSYVTGSQHLKAGFQFKHGQQYNNVDTNADLQQVYPSFTRDAVNNITFPTGLLLGAGSPCSGVSAATTCSVTIRNTPRQSKERLVGDLGLYVQDSFTLKQLTLNAGVRYEWLNSQVDGMTAPAGRFVPARTQNVRSDIPNWKSWAPRFQAVYDLFGNARTAVKYSLSKYSQPQTTLLAASFNGLGSQTASRSWTDLNQDDVAQGQRTWNADGTSFTDCVYLTPGCEINLSGTSAQGVLSPTFGLISEGGTYQPFPRTYRVEHGIEVQHALLPRLSLTGTWYHSGTHNLTKTVDRAALAPDIDYVPLVIYNPITGRPITYYNQTSTASTRPTDNVTSLEPLNQAWNDTYSAEFRMRPYAGAQVSGGITLDRAMAVNCESSDRTVFLSPNKRFCDTRNMVEYDGGPRVGKPFSKDFKVSGSFPLWYGVNLGVSYQNLDQGTLAPIYTFSRTIRYPDGTDTFKNLVSVSAPACPTAYGCQAGGITASTFVGAATGASLTLFATGTIRAERLNQLDLRASKAFRVKSVSISPAFEAFNIFNADMIINRVSSSYAVAAGTYLAPNSILQGRILGLSSSVKW